MCFTLSCLHPDPCIYTSGHLQTLHAGGFPDTALAQIQHPLAPRLTDPHSPSHTKHRHSCVQSPQMLAKPPLCIRTQVPTDTLNHTQTSSTQIQNQTKPLPSHTRRFAQRLQTYRYTLFLADPPAQVKPTSLPSRTAADGHFGPTSSQLFPNFSGEAKVSFSQGGRGTEPQVPERGGVSEAEGLYPYAWAPSTKSSCPKLSPSRPRVAGRGRRPS